jgi:purine-cytosine permease-like protein
MGLLWVTMVASFPAVLIGFDWYKEGFSLKQTIEALVLSMGVMLLYTVPIITLATKTGLSFKLLCKKFFGSQFSGRITLCISILYMGWYAVMSLMMADATCGVLGCRQYFPLLAFVFSFAMAFNNFFGFTGVANFARFIGAPVVIAWIVYIFGRVAPAIPSQITASHDTLPFYVAFFGISQFILGYSIWGNEADYWRNGQVKPVKNAIAVASAQILGVIIFPLTGFLIATQTGITNSADATAYINTSSFGKAAVVGLLFLAAQYFASNDSNLYAFVHAVESFTKMSHRRVVSILALAAGLLAASLAVTGTQSALESICALNSVLLPTATVLLVAEWLFFRKDERLESLSASKSAFFAWSAGVAIGILTSGVIPGLKGLSVGVPALQAWVVALMIYLPLRRRETSTSVIKLTIGRPELPVINDYA